MLRVAIDCDLRKVFALSSQGAILASGAKTVAGLINVLHILNPDEILFEVAGAVDYTSDKATAYNKRRWTIFNISQAALMAAAFDTKFLVAPSSAWTEGYGLEVRHKIAGATGMNKDLRECHAMLASRTWVPKAWVPWASFLAKL